MRFWLIAELAFEFLESIANDFEGINGRNWSAGIGIFRELFPSDGARADGMDPLQQMVAEQIVDKLKDNMDGYYPAISRIVLLTLWPLDGVDDKPRSARSLLKQAAVSVLKRLPDLADKDFARVVDKLPVDIQFIRQTGQLVRTFRGGEQATVRISELPQVAVSFSPENVAY